MTEPRTEQHHPSVVVRRMTWAVIVILASVCALLVVSQAAVLEMVRTGADHLFGSGSPITATASQPTPSPTAPRSFLDLAGETTLGQAQRNVTFPIRVPSYPPDLGYPDHVFLQYLQGSVVVLVWIDAQQPGKVSMSLHQFEYHGAATETPTIVAQTTVRGQPALWTDGLYPLVFLVNGQERYETRRLVRLGRVLVWQESGITYRLETDLPPDEATRVAESLH